MLTLGITVWQECNDTTDRQLALIQNQLMQIEQTLNEIELVITDLSTEENDGKIVERLEALLQEIKQKMFTVGKRTC